jgi:hypothetical protein
MTSLTFKCPMYGNQMKQIHFGKGRPNIKIEFDIGDGTSGTINTSFMFCNVCNNLQFFVPSVLYLVFLFGLNPWKNQLPMF